MICVSLPSSNISAKNCRCLNEFGHRLVHTSFTRSPSCDRNAPTPLLFWFLLCPPQTVTLRANGATLGCAEQRAAFFFISRSAASVWCQTGSGFFFSAHSVPVFSPWKLFCTSPHSVSSSQQNQLFTPDRDGEKVQSLSSNLCNFSSFAFSNSVKVEKNVNDLSVPCL